MERARQGDEKSKMAAAFRTRVTEERDMNPDQMFDVPVQHVAWGHATASDADGLELHYVRWGQGTPRVLLLHGWPGFWYDWRRVLPRLAQFPSHIRR